jgi:predicted dinucleotide-binding enzyme
MRIVFLVSTIGFALALKLAKSGHEAMIAVLPAP